MQSISKGPTLQFNGVLKPSHMEDLGQFHAYPLYILAAIPINVYGGLHEY